MSTVNTVKLEWLWQTENCLIFGLKSSVITVNVHGYNESRLQRTFFAGPGEFIITELDSIWTEKSNVSSINDVTFFESPPAHRHAFYYWWLSTIVTKSLTPSPPKIVTSFMDDPKLKEEESFQKEIAFSSTFIISFEGAWEKRLERNCRDEFVFEIRFKLTGCHILFANAFSALRFTS
jgi:hypothetical protein